MLAALNIHRAFHRLIRIASGPLKASRVTLERPVFIWGNGQSGTYLLYDLLALSEAFAYPSVSGWRKKGIADLMSIKPIEGEPTMWGGVGLPWDRVPVWIHDQVLTAKEANNIDLKTVRKRYSRLFETWVWQDNAILRVLDKSPNYLLMTEVIDRAFPDAVHVFAMRDQEAILDSIVRRFEDPKYRVEENWTGPMTGWYGNILLPGHETRKNWAVRDRHRWQIEQVLEIGHKAADRIGSRCIRTRHEDLLDNPRAALTRICKFLEVPVPDIPLGAIRPRTPTRPPLDNPPEAIPA